MAVYVLSNSFMRAANSVMMHWLFFYLAGMGMKSHNGTIVLVWSVSIYAGSVVMGFVNREANRLVLIISLSSSAIILGLLSKFAFKSNTLFYATLVPCALFLGGPFGLFNGKIALELAEHN